MIAPSQARVSSPAPREKVPGKADEGIRKLADPLIRPLATFSPAAEEGPHPRRFRRARSA